MKHYATYTAYGTTAMQVSETAVRIRGNVYDFQQPVTVAMVKALVLSLSKGDR
jgi:hypothetical protein